MEKSKILFILVLYNQEFYSTKVYGSLLKHIENEDIFIWDNSLNPILNVALYDTKYNYRYSDRNLGVSHPYNEGCIFAIDHGYQWVTFLDQDTLFSENYLLELHSSLENHSNIKLFCPIHKLSNGLYLSPVRSIWKCSTLSTNCIKGMFNIEKYVIINSGLTINIDLFKKTGGYNEKTFLDYSDFQFLDRCSKYISIGYCIDSICLQEFSNNILNVDSLLNRFELFCKSLRGCEISSFKTYIGYQIVVLKRLLSLIYRLKSLYPICIYYKYYLRKGK